MEMPYDPQNCQCANHAAFHASDFMIDNALFVFYHKHLHG